VQWTSGLRFWPIMSALGPPCLRRIVKRRPRLATLRSLERTRGFSRPVLAGGGAKNGDGGKQTKAHLAPPVYWSCRVDVDL
jgi:hypothetical protein